MKILMTLTLLLGLTGCAAPHVLLVNTRTGEVQTCKPSRFYLPSLAGQIVSRMETSSCAEQMEGLGFKRATNLTDEERANMQPRIVNPDQRHSIDISR